MRVMKTNTLRRLAQEALDIQNACNLCGLAQRFAQVQIELGEFTSGTAERNQHPVTILWLDKMNSLAGIQSFEPLPRIDAAYEWVLKSTANDDAGYPETPDSEGSQCG